MKRKKKKKKPRKNEQMLELIYVRSVIVVEPNFNTKYGAPIKNDRGWGPGRFGTSFAPPPFQQGKGKGKKKKKKRWES